jgi:hypothetical protein
LEYRIILEVRSNANIGALQCANGQNNIYGSALCLIRFNPSHALQKEGDKIVKKDTNEFIPEPLPFSLELKATCLKLPNQNRRVFYFFGHIDNIKQVQIFSKLVLNEYGDFSCN